MSSLLLSQLTAIHFPPIFSMNTLFSLIEARQVFHLSLPIVLAQISQTGMNFVDTVMAGRYSAEDLAGVAVASSIWVPVTIFAIGCLLALPAMSAQLVGARRPERAAHLLRQGLFLSVALSVILVSVLYILSSNMPAFGIGPDMEPVARGYLRALLPGVPGFLFFVNLRSFFEGFGRTRPAMYTAFFCLLLNIPCNWIFIYGHMGMPELGGVGCGVATSICFWAMAFVMLFTLHFDRQLGCYSLLRRQPALRETPFLDLPILKDVLRVGLPNAVAISVETLLFCLTALLLAPLGAVVVAGHQICINLSALIFCVPLSVSMAATLRVGRNLGAGNRLRARISAWTALCAGMVLAVCAMTLTLLFREELAALYNDDPQVLALVCDLLLFCAAYQVVDAIQCITAGILRGYNDTRVVSIICILSYGIVGLTGGYLAARTDLLVPAMGAAGFWAAYIACMIVCAIGYQLRLRYLHGLDMNAIRRRLPR